MEPKDRIIIALDVNNPEEALAIVDDLKKYVSFFKVGFELFSSCGPSIVREISKKGCRVFLDLKYHDIPNTVAKAAASVARSGVFMFNVHALGGYEMMKKAADALKEEAKASGLERPKIIAVTILTSMDEIALKKIGIGDSMKEEVLRLARLAREAGLDGVVASPSEIKLLRENIGRDFLIVTPGIRPEWAASGDQKRIATPKEAIASGADFIVIGRPVTGSDNRGEAIKRIVADIS